MKQAANNLLIKNSSIEKKGTPLPSIRPCILADSHEVLAAHYQQKIKHFEQALSWLNIIDNTKEIIAICEEIKHCKKMLGKIVF
jgi:hypothetical protein